MQFYRGSNPVEIRLAGLGSGLSGFRLSSSSSGFRA